MADFPTWLAALRRSHERMTALVGGLTDEQATLRSYADEWSLAQVASHLGSQAEVFELFLTAGLAGTDSPDADLMVPIWDRWNELSPRSQLADKERAEAAVIADYLSCLQAICDTLNREQVPTARGGASWRPSSLSSILRAA